MKPLAIKQRLYSLDVFRGATVALMILVNNPGSWSHIFAPFAHAAWHGCTPTDLVFPFFLFAVGSSMSYVLPNMRAAGSAVFLKKVYKRFALIFLLGLFLNWSPFVFWQNGHLLFKGWTWQDSAGTLHGIRVLGVLQRIAICYLLASLFIYYLGLKSTQYLSVLILFGYWILCWLKGSSTDPYSLEGYFGTRWDLQLFGSLHMYHGEGIPFEPEGLASTLPATVNVIIGYSAGAYIRRKPKMYNMLSHLFVAGAILLFCGFTWDLVFPINKKIWSSSFVLYSSGVALMVIGLIIYALEFRSFHRRRWQDGVFDVIKWLIFVSSGLLALTYVVIHFRYDNLNSWPRAIQFMLLGAIFSFAFSVLTLNQWSHFVTVFGKNPLFIFVLSGFLPRLLGLIRIPNGLNDKGLPQYISPLGWWYEYICKPLTARQQITSFIYALSLLLFFWLIAWWMNRKRIYIKV